MVGDIGDINTIRYWGYGWGYGWGYDYIALIYIKLHCVEFNLHSTTLFLA
jgi:hypothetical protein